MSDIKLGPCIDPVINLSSNTKKHRDLIFSKIQEGFFSFTSSKCFCHVKDNQGNDDTNIFEYDAWGYNIPTVLCNKCGTIRSKFFLTEDSLKVFYSDGYDFPHMYFHSNPENNQIGMSSSEYFLEEEKKGKNIYNFINSHTNISSLKYVLEVGCGGGGILNSFQEKNYICYGSDFNYQTLSYGKKKYPKINLYHGGLENFKKELFDIIILSDFVEHLSNPLNFFLELKKNTHNNTIIFINVPGFFEISCSRFQCNVRNYFKLVHLWCFHLESLKLLLNLSGYKFIFGNEYVKAIFKAQPDDKISDKNNHVNAKNIKKFMFYVKFKRIILYNTKIYIFYRLLTNILKKFIRL
jgi:SAM-dependent methyltransferase